MLFMLQNNTIHCIYLHIRNMYLVQKNKYLDEYKTKSQKGVSITRTRAKFRQ